MTQHHPSLEELSSYLDGQIGAAQRLSLERHLGGCPLCQRELEELRFAVALLRRVSLVEPRRSFTLQPAPVRRPWPWLRWATAVAAVLLAAVISLDVMTTLGAISLAPPPPMASPPPLARQMDATATPTTAVSALEEQPEAGITLAPADEAKAPIATPPPPVVVPPPVYVQPPLRWVEAALVALVALLGSLTLVVGRHRRRV